MPPRFVISLDLELRWGVPDTPLDAYRENLLGAHRAVPEILERLEAHGVGATWATVGALFARDRSELFDARPAIRPTYRDRSLDPWRLFDEAGASEADDLLHFGSSLVDRVLDADHQEMASHTFAHTFCGEPDVRADAVRADLEAAQSIARSRGVVLRSIVFPRNQYNASTLEAAAATGFTAYRGVPDHPVYRATTAEAQYPLLRLARLADHYVPVVQEERLLHTFAPRPGRLTNVPASRFLRPIVPTLRAFERVRMRRMRREMTAAAQTGRLYHLWWHPHNFGVDLDAHLAMLDELLAHVDRLRDEYGMQVMTMGDAPIREAA